MRLHRLAAVALAALAVAACKEKEATGAIPRQRFVRANVDLRSVMDTVHDADSLRAAALRRHRVRERDLLRFVQVHGGNPQYMADVWREISDSLQKRWERDEQKRQAADSTARADSARADSARGRHTAPPPPAPPVIVRPSGEPVPVPPPPAPPAGKNVARRPPPPTDRRPMKPPVQVVRPPRALPPAPDSGRSPAP